MVVHSHNLSTQKAKKWEIIDDKEKSNYLLARFLSCPLPAIIKSQRSHTEVYISYKLIVPLPQASY